MPIHYVN